MQALETERLLLRPFTIDDLDDFYEYASSPNVGPAAGWAPHGDKDISLEKLTSFIEKDEVWAIEFKENKKVVGSVGLVPDQKREGIPAKMIGYVLSEDYWGKGLMSEAVNRVLQYAFEDLKLDLVSVYHYPFNKRSRRVIEKSGFKYEGTLRLGHKIFDGTVLDDVCYSMTKDEYCALKR